MIQKYKSVCSIIKGAVAWKQQMLNIGSIGGLEVWVNFEVGCVIAVC